MPKINKQPMSVVDHLQVANDLNTAIAALDRVAAKLAPHYPVFSESVHLLNKLMGNSTTFRKLRHRLDDDYQKVASDAEYQQLGAPYLRMKKVGNP